MLIRFGTIRAFEARTYLADVELGGYVATYVSNVPVAYHLRQDLVVDGTKCVVLFLDALNPSNAVVIALFSGRPAEDPKFDPVVGHRHMGVVGDGPKLG